MPSTLRRRASALQRAVNRAALALVFALIGSFVLGCTVLAMAFLIVPSVATVAGHMAAMFSFPVWFVAVLAQHVLHRKNKARP